MKLLYYLFQLIVWLIFFFITRIFSNFKIEGQENIKKSSKPLLIVANHRSFIDPFIIGTLFPPTLKYLPMAHMVDDKYYRGILKPFFFILRTFPSYYGQGLDISLKKPRQTLKEGGIFLIFPSGQRDSNGVIPKPKRGVAVLVLENSKINILPIYLNLTAGWKLRDFLLRRKSIKIFVGEPFKLKDKTESQDINEVSQIIAQEVEKLAQTH